MKVSSDLSGSFILIMLFLCSIFAELFFLDAASKTAKALHFLVLVNIWFMLNSIYNVSFNSSVSKTGQSNWL